MSNYTKTVDFAIKDTLSSGDAQKRILGTEINTEFNNIAIAVATKLDSSSFTASNLTTGVLAIGNGGTGTNTTTYCSLTTNVTGTLPTANGGTGLTGFGAANSLLLSSSSTALLALGTVNTGVLTTTSTGTVQYTLGTTANRVLRTDGTTISFSQINLTSDITGALAVANGGTGASDAGTARTNLDVPQRNGTGATGTWGINISGNAATATTSSGFSGTLNAATQLTGIVPVANGGTGGNSVSNAGTSLGIIGVNQTWSSQIGSRAINTDYQNTTGRPISVSVALTTVSAGSNDPIFWVSTTSPATGGTEVAYFTNGTTGTINATVGPVIIPNNAYYRVQAAVGTSVAYWAELR